MIVEQHAPDRPTSHILTRLVAIKILLTCAPKRVEAAMEVLFILATGDFWVELTDFLSGDEEYSSQRIVTVVYMVTFQGFCQVLLLCVLWRCSPMFLSAAVRLTHCIFSLNHRCCFDMCTRLRPQRVRTCKSHPASQRLVPHLHIHAKSQ